MLSGLIGRFGGRYRGQFTIVVLLQAVASVASLMLPNLNARIIDTGVANGDTAYIWRAGARMLAVGGTQAVAQCLAAVFGARLAMGIGRDIRAGLFDTVLGYSSQEVNHFGAPSLITRTTNDVQQVQQLLLMTCIMILGAPITMIGAIVMALRQDMGLSWIVAVAALVLVVLVGAIVSRMTPAFRRNQESIDRINQVVREQLSGIRVIRAFIRERRERKRFDLANQSLMLLGFRIGTFFSLLAPLVMLIMNASTVAVWWFGALRVESGDMQVGQITAFMTYMIQMLLSVMMAAIMMIQLPRAQVCARRIMEVLNTGSTVTQPAKPVRKLAATGEMDMTNVVFSYPGAEEPVLHDINLSLRPGTTTAVIGSTGSGKTTLANLVPRLYDVTGGSIKLDGVDLRKIDMDLMWSRIGLVPQKPYLFSGTVASNLRYGNPEATEEQMWAALRTAQAADFVEQMDGQLEAPITQGGTNVSGGQRQRLSIARALVKKPEIYVFDDAFSALDVATDARLRAALAAETQDAAVLIIAQRVSTIRDADQIIVLDSGHVVGRGTHAELLDGCETYQEIVSSQMSAEEAAA
ncbi:ABC transporter ATP-binding protein [Propionibacterium australiense]|uniref:AAA+ ATPase domain n=1 Tax=Propionibacterium australiense TaxID=119981 RepID=A0A383S6X6_9ACTN|nr:ABC transporter ATP-binding protein [Propionibacterium australiense]RLP07688.1 ATP-binding cassette domain-containing protein [Propionibacterium australiense]RLP08115.1 ATP-binding cassette domain-containing protein [Propionibacterium australiense]SYZ33677.1 AAA+ ATPase domain [Propionibacterium australiense]VEH92951.1 Putative multidrug export ATP-binding/permease protein SAV1866 [Propionibacterium australiense]